MPQMHAASEAANPDVFSVQPLQQASTRRLRVENRLCKLQQEAVSKLIMGSQCDCVFIYFCLAENLAQRKTHAT